jgi:hypothetical protein
MWAEFPLCHGRQQQATSQATAGFTFIMLSCSSAMFVGLSAEKSFFLHLNGLEICGNPVHCVLKLQI